MKNLEQVSRVNLEEKAGLIKQYISDSISNAIKIGKILLDVKNSVDTYEYKAWLTSNFAWSAATAWRFVQISKHFEPYQKYLNNFDITAVYLLASPSCPDEARAKAVEISKKVRITKKKALEILAPYQTQKPHSDEGSPPILEASLEDEAEGQHYLPLPRANKEEEELQGGQVEFKVEIDNAIQALSLLDAITCLDIEENFFYITTFTEIQGLALSEIKKLSGFLVNSNCIVIFKGDIKVIPPEFVCFVNN